MKLIKILLSRKQSVIFINSVILFIRAAARNFNTAFLSTNKTLANNYTLVTFCEE